MVDPSLTSIEEGKKVPRNASLRALSTKQELLSKITEQVDTTTNVLEEYEERRDAVCEKKNLAIYYDSTDHLKIITQMYGSVLPRVISFCIFNCTLTVIVYYLKQNHDINLAFSDKGHSFMSALLSFLIVTRVNIAYSRFTQARNFLDNAMRSCREIIQYTICFTRKENGVKAKKWRAEIARRTIVLLRTLVCILEYPTKKEDLIHKESELTIDEVQALLLAVGGANDRTPMVLTIFIRTVITASKDYLEEELHVNKEREILNHVANFVTAYHGLINLANTPFPFPLVQMARTFLFVWITTLPCALMNDIKELLPLVFAVFIITYGFVGLEYVAMELDDPFGDDPNDFDVVGLAEVVFDDIYIAIHDIDGKQAADDLRKNVTEPLPELTKKTVRKHSRYTSVDTWKIATDDESQLSEEPESERAPTKKYRKLSSIGLRNSELLKPNLSGNRSTSGSIKETPPKPEKKEKRTRFSLDAVFQNISARTLQGSVKEGDEESHPFFTKTS